MQITVTQEDIDNSIPKADLAKMDIYIVTCSGPLGLRHLSAHADKQKAQKAVDKHKQDNGGCNAVVFKRTIS